MKLLKFNSIKMTFGLTILETVIIVLLMNGLSMLVVDTKEKLLINLSILLGLYIINRIVQYVKLYSIQVSMYYVRRQLSERVSRYYQNMGITSFKEKSVGERVSMYINDIPQILVFVVAKKIEIVYCASLLIFSLVALFRINYIIFLISLGLNLMIIIVPKFFSKKLSKAVIDSQATRENFMGKMTELLSGIFEFAGNDAFGKYDIKSHKYCADFAKGMGDVEIFAGKMTAILTFCSNISILLSLGITSYLVLQGKLSAGILLAVMGVVSLMGECAQMLMTNHTMYKSGLEFYNAKFNNIEEYYSKELIKPLFLRKLKLKDVLVNPSNSTINTISTKGLEIIYGDKRIGIKDIIIEKGKKYILVGDSGCGKSSLLKAILGINNNYDGSILIDGKEKDKNQALYDKIAYVSQDTFLFNDTLENNIKLGNDQADTGLLLSQIGLAEFKENYLLGENGGRLSGGQRQRIALARALAREKDIIFLDESTANLDENSTRLIEDIVLNSDKTVVMITHKLDEISKSKADMIINLSE